FRRGQDGEREVSDIVFRGTKDLYDTPEQARARAAQAHSDRAAGPRTTTPGTGAVADTRYREAPASGDKPSSTDTRPQSVIDRLRAQRNQAGHFNVNQQRMLEEI
ncbi:MAG: hypothetical protein JSS86_15585, partial [Cyanobacteria bacterium SZAS LIN-2]|nr:hypothetical protein [Cyanobacteria bacterium SZAS LIN-2]